MFREECVSGDISQTAAAAWPWPDSLDALIAAADYHFLILENERVRVLQVIIPPGAFVPVHTHRWPSVINVVSSCDFIRRDHNASLNILTDALQACGRAGRVIVRRCASMALTGISSVTRAKVTKAPPDFRPERDEGTVAWWEKATEGKCPFPRRLSARPYMVRP